MSSDPRIQILQTLIDALNAESRINSISPQRMANIVQRILDLFKELEPDSYLRKDQDDRSPHKINVGDKLTAEGGLQVGPDFISGLMGLGTYISPQGDGEMSSLSLRKWLEVPEIRFNKTEVISGTSWRAPGGGIIEEVIPDINPDGSQALTGLARLKLEDGEIGEIKTDDLCQGIWHFDDGSNLSGSEDGFTEDDSRGNFRQAGFMTVYFRITDVLDSNNRTFLYALRSEANEGAADIPWPYRAHPAVGMHFVAYTNLTDVSRQTSCYETRSYTRYLKGVRSWNYSASHIMMQFGDLSNLSVHGLDMSGYSAFLNNIYMRGTLQKIEAPILSLVADVPYNLISKGESSPVTIRALVDDLPLSADGSVSDWSVRRDSSDPAADAAWNALGHTPVDGELELSFDDLNDRSSAMFSVSAKVTEVIHSLSGDHEYSEILTVSFVIHGLETIPTDRGPWAVDQHFFSGDTRRPETGRFEISDSWHLGRKWRCIQTHISDSSNAPCHGSEFWIPIEGDDSFSIRFLESYGLLDPDSMDITLTVDARKGNEDVSDSPLVSYEWSRYTEQYDGTPRTMSDAAWASRQVDGIPRKWSGKSIRLTRVDCDWDSLGPGKVHFTVLATLQSGQTAEATFGAS